MHVDALDPPVRSPATGAGPALFLSVFLSACAGGGHGPFRAPAPVAAGVGDVEVRGPALPPEAGPVVPGPPVDGLLVDEILHSPWSGHPQLEERVGWWVSYWSGTDGTVFPRYLERMSAFEPLVAGALLEEGLPPSLRYLPLVESGYSPGAVSRAAAVGLWQFNDITAREVRLRTGPFLDERRDPVLATRAAVRYLGRLKERFGSWFLALAAYNAGPSRLAGILAERAPGVPGSDSLYVALRSWLPTETAEFVPRFLAAARLARGAEAFGVAPPARQPVYAYEEVVVDDATSLVVVARAAGVPEEDVVALNPHYPRGVTPVGVESLVRVPPGTAWSFRRAYAAIPPAERVTLRVHRVGEGETLWDLAVRYGVELGELRAANPGLDPRRLPVGYRLVVPRHGGDAPAAGPRPGGDHVVAAGESLWSIARRYGVRVEDLRRWNGLGEDVIQPGQRLRVGPADG